MSEINKMSSEQKEWLDALISLAFYAPKKLGSEIVKSLIVTADSLNLLDEAEFSGAFVNSVTAEASDPVWQEDDQIASNWVRWNAMAMVVRTNRAKSELGGHIATYASQAFITDVGMHYFFKARNEQQKEDLIFYQGHASPGIYARAFLEGRLTKTQLENFRQEVDSEGVSSYPHPWLMPNFWQFPTVSMGLGPLCAIYQARLMKYLVNRKLMPEQNRKVWVFCGDGEMDEPESTSGLTLAGREKLDNLIMVVNCNLQRLDGPVRSNDNIINELAAVFRAAGWRVIKVLWNSAWDKLFANDTYGILAQKLADIPDGEYQNLATKGGRYWRENFFNSSPELKSLIKAMSDSELDQLGFGGHDPQKVIAAYRAAVSTKGKPVVILPKTIKGYGMGAEGEATNPTHQKKKLSDDDLKRFVKRFKLPISDQDAANAEIIMPESSDPGLQRLRACRNSLGGCLPARHNGTEKLKAPSLEFFQPLLESSGDREISTTMAFVRFLNLVLRDKDLKDRIVPILADESRTFGMEGLFRQIGIYAPFGQRYEPIDRDQMMYYKESKTGQLLQEGLNEAGSIASWMAAASSYSCHDVTLIPFYIFYSMFGVQRVGDFMWAAGDQRCRGFLLGATSGRTTLAGEGLQHNDGHSQLWVGSIPNCLSYDPTYAYELAVIMRDGIQKMYYEHQDVYYYITVTNDNIIHPSMPEGVEQDIIKGMYCLQPSNNFDISLMGCGAILPEVVKASDMLREHGVNAEVWSVPSFNEVRRDAQKWQRKCLLQPEKSHELPHIKKCLGNSEAPVLAATDYVKLLADQLSPYIDRPYEVLGTDGFSRSGTRAQLRRHFEVDAAHITYAALVMLARREKVSWQQVAACKEKLGINEDLADPLVR